MDVLTQPLPRNECPFNGAALILQVFIKFEKKKIVQTDVRNIQKWLKYTTTSPPSNLQLQITPIWH
jgi:hypothetical protein